TSTSSLPRSPATSCSSTKSTASKSPNGRRWSGRILLGIVLAPLFGVGPASPTGHEAVMDERFDLFLPLPHLRWRKLRLAEQFFAELARGEVVHRQADETLQGVGNIRDTKHTNPHPLTQQVGDCREDPL